MTLPTIVHGEIPPDMPREVVAAIMRSTQDILAILNSVPLGAMRPTLVSVIMSFVTSQTDPMGMLTLLAANAYEGVQDILSQPTVGTA